MKNLSEMRLILGIDPGAQGAIALVGKDRAGEHVIECEDMPAPDNGVTPPALFASLLRSMLHGYDAPEVAVIEAVNARPPTGASTACKLGKSAGIATMGAAMLGIRVVTPTPAVWKRAMRVGSKQRDPRAVAAERWPADADLFARVKDRDRAEACLLAAFWLDGHGAAQ